MSFCHFHGTVAVWKFVRRTILGKYGYRVDVPTYLSNQHMGTFAIWSCMPTCGLEHLSPVPLVWSGYSLVNENLYIAELCVADTQHTE